MNILVTGASGFLGLKTIIYLIKKGHKIIGLDLKKNKIKNKCYKHYLVNINNFKKVKKIFIDNKDVDLIIHTAAYQPLSAEHNINKYLNINLMGTKNIAEAAKTFNIKNFIFCSSFSVYENKEGPLSEKIKLNPRNTYGLSKKLSEDLLEYYSKNFSINTIILRFDGIYGYEQNLPGFIKMCMNEIINDKDIILFNKGKLKRDYLYVEDAVKSIYLSVLNIKKIKFEILNIGGGNPTKAVTLFKKMKKIFKSKSNAVYSPKKNKNIIKNIFMNVSQAKKIINFKSNTLDNNLRKMYNDYKKK